MIIYHPATDAYHCAYRILQLIELLPDKTCEKDILRILDFYLLFPSLLHKVKLPRSASGFRKMVLASQDAYEVIEDPHKVFMQLETFQDAAIRCLASCELISVADLRNNIIKRTDNEIPKDLKDAIDKSNSDNKNILSLLTGPLFDIDFYGNQGLKARTSLMEFRYDPQ